MIYGLFGRPRSGKSYEATRYYILKSLQEGRMVVTNIPMQVEMIRSVYGDDAANLLTIVKTDFGDYGAQRPFSLPADYTKYEWKDEDAKGPLFVIDEAHLCLGREAKTPVLEYLSMHGHYGHDIYLLSQNPRKIHRDIKDMVEVSFRFVKKSIYGEDSGYIKKAYHGVSSSNADFITMEEKVYDPSFFKFYQSHTQSTSAVTESKSIIRADRVKGKKLFVTMIVLGTFLAVFSFKRMISPDVDPDPEPIVKIDDTTSPIASAAAPPDTAVNTVEASVSVTPNMPSPSFSDSNIKQPPQKLQESKTTNQLIYESRVAESKSFHPFHRVILHIRGISTTGDYANPVKKLSLIASQNGQQVFGLSSSDLIAAGYEVEIYADCSALIRYYEYKEFLTCDSPSVAVSTVN